MMQWMIVDFSLEEQLMIERQSRIAINHPNKDDISKLCSNLIKQNAHQAKLLTQAVGHIANLEAQLFLIQSRRPWWKFIRQHL
jgi:hypothetical protein